MIYAVLIYLKLMHICGRSAATVGCDIISCINYLVLGLGLGLGLILYNFAELAAGPIDTGIY